MRRIVAASSVAAVLLAPLMFGLSTGDAATTAPPVGTISRLPHGIPNYFYTDPYTFDQAALDLSGHPNRFNLESDSQTTALLADPVNNLLFETSASVTVRGSVYGDCSRFSQPFPVIRVDPDTYDVATDGDGKPIAGCLGPRPGGGSGTGTKSLLVAVDSTDGLLFSSDGLANKQQGRPTTLPSGTPPSVSLASDSIVITRESDLRSIRSWSLPTNLIPDYQTIYGLSWDAATDELIVETSINHQTVVPLVAPPAVALYAYDLRKALAGGGNPTPEWSYLVPAAACPQPLAAYSFFGTASAYRSLHFPYLYLPCAVTATNLSPSTVLILRLDLDSNGAPTGSYSAAEVPGNPDDFQFNAAYDLGFTPYQTNSASSVAVYDGQLGQFVGQASVATAPTGSTNPNLNLTSYAYDEASARAYAIGPAGLVVVDASQFPVRPGGTYTALGGDVLSLTLPVLHPDGAHPYPRIPANYLLHDAKTTADYMPEFVVLADTVPIPTATGVDDVDSATYQGPIPAGATVSAVYSGTAAAVGVRSVWNGSYGNVVNNTTAGGNAGNANGLPLATGVRDLLAGWVQEAQASNTLGNLGSATSLGDGNNTTTAGVRQCTNVRVLGSCLNTNPGGGDQNPLNQGNAPDTGQAWPAGEATCFQPGPDDAKSSTAKGLRITGSRNADGTAQPQVLPGSDQDAQAQADCAVPATPSNAVLVSSVLRALGVGGGTGAPTLTVASASGQGRVVPPETIGKQVTATATAQARGIRIALPGGVGVSIGEVSQNATAAASGFLAGAKGTRRVAIADVVVTTPSASYPLCEGPCTDSDATVAQLNQIDPSNLHFELPEPDSPFATATASNGVQTVPGSRHGYFAAVQDNLPQQQYDAQFNAIPTGDGETSLLPALRMSIYYDAGLAGSYGRDRQVVDFAAVEADAQNGIQVFVPGSGGSGGGGGDGSGGQPGPGGTPGTPGHYIPGTPGHYIPGTPGTPGYYVPGTPAALTSANVPLPGDQVNQPLVAAVDHYLKRALHGLSLVLRDPAQALRFFGLLVVLLAPVLLMARRQQWLRGILGGSS